MNSHSDSHHQDYPHWHPPREPRNRIGFFGCLQFVFVLLVLLGMFSFLWPYLEPLFLHIRDALSELPGDDIISRKGFRVIIWAVVLGVLLGACIALLRNINRR